MKRGKQTRVPEHLLSDEQRSYVGYRLYFNTIADKEWLAKKANLRKSGKLTKNSFEGYKQFMKEAEEAGVYRSYSGIVQCIEVYDPHPYRSEVYYFLVKLDTSCRDENDVEMVRVKFDTRYIYKKDPTDIDLMEMMTQSNEYLRNFALKFYNQQSESLATVLDLLTQMSDETRLEVLNRFCRACGKPQCSCG